MRHAYLILAHHEFAVLRCLVQVLDDSRNDIFIHFDAKVKSLPLLKTRHSKLHILSERIDVRWGHVSQIEAEYMLLAAAQDPVYAFFHIISGVHLPLVGQNEIHHFFQNKQGIQLVPKMEVDLFQIDQKMNRYNLFMPYFAHRNRWISRVAQIGWRMAHMVQRFFCIRRQQRFDYRLGSNWVSLTNDAVAYLLSVRNKVVKRFKYTLCADEFFVPSVLSSSSLDFNIEYSDRLLAQVMERANAKTFGISDLNALVESNCLFARKFGSQDMEIVERMVNRLKK